MTLEKALCFDGDLKILVATLWAESIIARGVKTPLLEIVEGARGDGGGRHGEGVCVSGSACV